MTLYKRREFSLQLPDGKLVHPFAAASAEVATTKAAALAAAHGLASWTLHRDPEATFSFSFRHAGRVYARDTQLKDRRKAEEFARRFREQVLAGRLDTLRALQLRRSPDETTLRQVVQAFERYAAVANLAPATTRNYVVCMRRIAALVWPDRPLERISVSDLTAKAAYRFREAVTEQAAGADDARRRQVQRSANSMLNQARSLFSTRALEHYRLVAQLLIPDSIREWMDAPAFTDTVKEEYRLPSDAVVAATFAALATLQERDPDVWAAVWLALGFGLRKSEIAAVRVGWFRQTPQGVVLELQGTMVPTTIGEKACTKNGSVTPMINCTNGAWQHLGPVLAGRDPGEYVLRAPTATGRSEEVFRRLSLWMRGLGWETSKTAHELRAFAGCQVARRDGIEAASRWLRHSSILVTQRHYGRYLRPVVTDAPLQIPTVQPFVPQVVTGG